MITLSTSRFIRVLAFLISLVGVSAASLSAELRNFGRPFSVPEEFVLTPNGYFHPSCLQRVEVDEVLDLRAGAITKDGIPTKMLKCDYSHFDADGKEIATTTAGRTPPPAQCPSPNAPCGGNGGGGVASSWVIWDAIYTPSSVQEFWETMIVPNAPSVVAGQVVYLFPGLQESTTYSITILQPVISWNGIDFPNQWSLASWNCCYNGVETYGTPVAVNSGDVINGTMTGYSCNVTTGVCATWTIGAEDLTTLKESILSSTSSDGQYFNGLFGAVLEAYYVTSCSEFPASPAYFAYNTNNQKYGPPFALNYVNSATWLYSPPSSWVTTKNSKSAAPAGCGYGSVNYGGDGGVYLTY